MSEESLGRISPPVENSSATRDEGDDETEVVGQPNMVSGYITVEEAIEKMGFGPFQILITVFSGLLWLADAMELMLLSVLSPTVQCQWGLNHSEAATITSVVFVGFLLGGLLWGIVSDFIGRKNTLLIVNILILIFGVLSAIKVAPDDPSGKGFGYSWLLTCRFGVGFGAGGTAQAVTYYSEFLPMKSRGVCLVLIEVWWAVGSMFGALLALGVMNSKGWHWYLGIATIPLFIVLFIFPFVPESARFYLIKGKPDKAKDVLRKVSWYNDKPLPEGEIVSVDDKMKALEVPVSYTNEGIISFGTTAGTTTEEEMPLLDGDEEVEGKPFHLNLLKSMKKRTLHFMDLFVGGMWKTTLLLWLLWIGCGWIYYGVVLLTTSIFQVDNHCFSEFQNKSNGSECEVLSNASYIKIFWTAVAELPGLVVTIIIIEVIGRKKTMAVEFAFTMVGFLLLFVCSTPLVTTLFLFLTRAFATGVFQAVYVYTPEVYATNVRASALGLHTTAARIGALVTPFNAQVVFHYNDIATVVLYAVSCLFMVFASLLLPIETQGKSMKDGTVHS